MPDLESLPRFVAHIRFLPTAEGGRKTPMLEPRCYRPHVRIDGRIERLGVNIASGQASLAPGEKGEVVIGLLFPHGPGEKGLEVDDRFVILEGPRVVGTGHVLRRLA